MIQDGYWLPVRDGDARLFALNRRHYSAIRNRDSRCREKIAGPGEYIALLTGDCLAGFVWKRMRLMDGQEGIYCSIFRNEGPVLSSDLIREADDLAWRRWPDEPRHFTYVDASEVRPKRNPGWCFIKAGWTRCGQSANGKLLFERVAA